jgi:type II secretory pathway pseudopilin PulG
MERPLLVVGIILALVATLYLSYSTNKRLDKTDEFLNLATQNQYQAFIDGKLQVNQ